MPDFLNKYQLYGRFLATLQSGAVGADAGAMWCLSGFRPAGTAPVFCFREKTSALYLPTAPAAPPCTLSGNPPRSDTKKPRYTKNDVRS